MTLNVTLITQRTIFQCADFRYSDWQADKWVDSGSQQKIQLVVVRRWSAVVCFNGVAVADGVDVSGWLAEKIRGIDHEDPLDRLFDELKTADAWIGGVIPSRRRHSFAIGAFDGSRPVYGLVSNYEQLRGPRRNTAASTFSAYRDDSPRTRSYIAGQPEAVDQDTRTRLVNLAKISRDRRTVLDALAAANKHAAATNKTISSGCCAMYVSRAGDAGSACYEIESSVSMLAIPGVLGADHAVAGAFKPGARIRQMVAFRRSDDEESLKTRLADYPNNPEPHVHYGLHLFLTKGDLPGAETAFREALRLDPRRVDALINLAGLRWHEEDFDGAEAVYKEAFLIDPTNELVAFNYGDFLNRVKNEYAEAIRIVEPAIDKNPYSSRLVRLRAVCTLMLKDYPLALRWYRRAREYGDRQADVELGYAQALRSSGAPIPECIAAYRTAFALNPENGALILNLAQLLLAIGAEEGLSLLEKALRMMNPTDSGRIEAQFYRLAHGLASLEEVLTELQQLISQGLRLDWDVNPNISCVKARDPAFADALAELASALSDSDAQERLQEWWRAMKKARPSSDN